ncbi:MAG: acyl-CoA dehydrogenase C-terminal domain-containing protein [Alphaproteobacteria bacterium]|nr:acyl-CoA dehydrogenase C-terminal domain-containing protein [Alphaproteobacteria bacterium SS10]
MPSYSAPVEDMRFVLHEVLNAESLSELPGYEDVSEDLIDAILEEAAKMAENELFPLNQVGDKEGCTYENGVVRTPTGFKEAYDQFREGGWIGLSADPNYGGQGMPASINFVLNEILSSANMAFAMYPGLSQGAYDAIHMHGSDELKDLYLPKLVDGIWSGTMCLTEPHCGTDLGLIRTKAVPRDDGSYDISGTKIFISAGEHDMTDNIVHLVLAKLPDAPPGVKGISLFLVPKFIPKEEGGDHVAGPRNGVMCGSIEHKMGIHGNATCVMNFDDAQGWLVGDPHKGLRAMFTMMNAARLGVAMQGLAIGEVSYQNGLAYAKDRRQGRALTGAKEPDQPADSIMVHPDVRRNFLNAKAITEASRALSYWIGMQIDVFDKHPDERVRRDADDLVSLMTPILKAFLTDNGTQIAIDCQQMLGGHGYVWEWGMEQYVRDARIAQIYEGANGIQALDLVGRKMPKDFGRLLRQFFHPVQEFLEEHQTNPELQEFVFPLAKAFGKLQQATGIVAQKGMKNPDEAGAASTDFLRLFGYVALGFMWAKMVITAKEKLPNANGKTAFYDGKIKTARYYMQKVLPEANACFIRIMAGSDPVMDLDEAQF